ncbi:hypothetical protein H8B13_02170 [Hymenobacter sp. BT188]|uniref:hypothetical protein n=1 Tax=Hymenobacter sp. BT188 TaxID=2763504 RepID=UPI0016518865|nr:hypothetical protein [Hymenobacter sp. BT188]MBC6605617.1 hypothetical protein [Hymenobacter sp. BT188]
MTNLELANLEEYTLSGGKAPSAVKIIQRKLTFDLPFVIMVDDNFGNGLIQSYYRGERKFNRTAVEIAKSTTIDLTPAHNFPNQTPLDTPPPYLVNTDKYGMVRITLLKVNSDGIEGELKDKEFMGSVSKGIGFTCVMIEFGSDTFNIDISSDHRPVHDMTLAGMEAFNVFLLNYKLIANKLYIPSVTVHTVGKFLLIDLHEDRSVSLTHIARQWEQPIPFAKTIPLELDKELRNSCLNAGEIDLFSVLRHEAWNKIVLQEWRMAVINSLILFESWLTPTLQEIYELKGLDEGKIKRKFKTDAPKSKDRKHLGITEIAETLVLDAIRYDFKKTAEYDNLLNKSIIVRNSIIHRSKLDVSQKDAYECIHSVMNAISAITNAIMGYKMANSLGGMSVYERYSPSGESGKQTVIVHMM